jgi:hypothetical protein
MPYEMYKDAVAVTPHDSNDQTNLPCDGLYVGGAGDVNVITREGTTVLFKAVPVGTTIPIGVKRVKGTNTDATHIVALTVGPSYS